MSRLITLSPGLWRIGVTTLILFVGIIFHAARISRSGIILMVAVVIGVILTFKLLEPAWTIPGATSPRMHCHNNARQLVQALHNYHDDHGCFPPSYVADTTGKPIHSWRTLLLPYLGQQKLYKQYNFNEPWDGPNNRKLANIPVRVFNCPSAKNWGTNRTNYVAVTGPGTIWPGEHSSGKEDVADSLSNTIILMEMDDSGICWMEPFDITIEIALGQFKNNVRVVPSSGHYVAGDYSAGSLPFPGHIAMADGECKFLLEQPSAEDLAALLSINGGESIDLEHIEYSSSRGNQIAHWDRIFGLPLFLITLVWLWIRMAKEPDKLQSNQVEE